MDTPGKLELTLKISTLPAEVTTTSSGWKKFTVEAEGKRIAVTIRPRMWKKLEDAAASFPQWLATITGTMGRGSPHDFALAEPAVQVFERKPKDAPPAAGT